MTRLRVLTALIMTPLAIAAVLLLPTPWLTALAAVVVLVALWEWLRLAGVDDGVAQGVLLVANLALMVALGWASRTSAGFNWVLLQLMVVLGLLWWLASIAWLGRFSFDSKTAKLAAGTLALVPAWCAMAVIHGDQPHGHRWLLAALAIVWAADTGAYFAGRKFGRRKLAPRISPNKTIEGLLGGVVAGIVAGLCVALLAGAAPAQLPAVALVALFTVLFSVVGDLFESLLKRQRGVKDSSNLIPGHGGLLDRVDGVIAGLPAFALGKDILGF